MNEFTQSSHRSILGTSCVLAPSVSALVELNSSQESRPRIRQSKFQGLWVGSEQIPRGGDVWAEDVYKAETEDSVLNSLELTVQFGRLDAV